MTALPSPIDPPAALYEQARALHAENEELRAVIERIKEYIAVMKQDKRMRVMAQILLDHVARIEKEEAERTQREGREG